MREHLERHVYQTQLVHGEILGHDLEQVVRQLDVILAVLTVLRQVLWREVQTVLVDSGAYLSTFFPDVVSQR